eukprot:520495_1
MSSNEEDEEIVIFGLWAPTDAQADQNPVDTQNKDTDHAKKDDNKQPYVYNNYTDKGEYIHSFNSLVSILEATEIMQKIHESTKMYSIIISQMVIDFSNININYQTMLLNISKKGWSSAEGSYGLSNLFQENTKCYCSSGNSGNCVDLLLDLKREYMFTSFHAWTTGWGYTCPLVKAYLWVFGSKTAKSIEHIKKLCVEQLYTKKKFQQLTIDLDVIDPETNERKRDEMIPVSCIDGSNEPHRGWKLNQKIASHIKGRYVLIKLIANGSSNVDAKYVGLEGYRM